VARAALTRRRHPAQALRGRGETIGVGIGFRGKCACRRAPSRRGGEAAGSLAGKAGNANHREQFRRGCDPLSVAFHASADGLCSKQANVLRITQRVAGEVVRGYTVVLLKK
jgi:hypothetical protein